MKAEEESVNLITEQEAPLSSKEWLKEIFHICVALASWILFLYFWYLTIAYKFSGSREFLELLFLFLFAVATFSAAISWVRHNLTFGSEKVLA